MKIRFLILGALILNLSCASEPTEPDRRLVREDVYNATFEETWRAAQMAMRGYRMRLVDYDIGLIETEPVKGFDAYRPPHIRKKAPSGLRYTLSTRLIKGSVGKKPLTKVIIDKKVELRRDFFAEAENQMTDGFEESTILYRIGREISINRAVQRMAPN